VILAPLASAFPLWFVKVINALMVAAAGALLWLTLRRYCGAAVATIFLLTFVCLSDVLFIWRTSTHSLSLAYILAGASLFAALLQRDWTPSRLIVLAAVLGSGFNFIDFLINPPMMPMLMAFFVLLSRRRDAGLGRRRRGYCFDHRSAHGRRLQRRLFIPAGRDSPGIPQSAEPRRCHRAAHYIGSRRALRRHRIAHRLARRSLAVDAGAGRGRMVRGALQPHPIPSHREFAQRRHGARNFAVGGRHFHAKAAEPGRIVGSVANAESQASTASTQARRSSRGLIRVPINKIVENLFAAVHRALFLKPRKTRCHAQYGASLRRGYAVCIAKL